MDTLTVQTLLTLSRTIATVRQKEPLLRLLIEQLQPAFGFYDCGLFVFNPDKTTLEDWTVSMPTLSPSEANFSLAEQQAATVPYQGSVWEIMFARLRAGQGALLHDYKEPIPGWQDYQQASVIDQTGYQESMMALLQVDGDDLGVFALNSLERGHFREDQLPFFQQVNHQVGVAVANILANEEILRREQEKDVLLKITQAIAAVNDKVTLLRTIFDLVQPVFQFDDLGLAILDSDKQHVTDWSAGTPGLSDSPVNAVLHMQQLARMDYPGTLLEHVIECVEVQGQPLLIALTDELAAQWPDAVYLPIEIEDGQKECLFTTLKTGGQLLGSFNLNSKQAGYLATTDHTLFQAIADQIAVAVANILANEEILQREREKTTLLAINRDMATVQQPKQLLNVIYQTIRAVLPYDNAGLYVLDRQGENLYEWTDAEVMPDALQIQLTAEGKLGPFPLRDLPPDIGIHANTIELHEIAELVKQMPANFQFEEALQFGLQQTISGPLFYGGQKIGLLVFSSKQHGFYAPSHFPLFQAIADQIAVAVANILANEEIREREQEKSLLLSISQQLSTIRNQEDLFNRFIHQLNNQLPFDEALVVLYDKSLQTRRYIYNHLPPPKNNLPDYQHLLRERLPVDGSPYEEIVTYEQPEIRTRAYWEAHYPNDLGLRIARDNGLVEGLYMPLYYRNQLLGTLVLHSCQSGRFRQTQLPLYSNLADQVAVAVANVLANEEILQREREKANLLAISTAIATIRDKDDLFRVITETVRPILGFDEAAQIFAIDPSDETIGIFLRNTSRMISDDADYQDLTRQRFPIAGSPFEKILAWPTVYLLDPVQEARQYPHYPGFPIMIRMGIRQSMITPLRYGGRVIGTFHVFSTRAGFFGPQHFGFYEMVANQIAVAVANILANEEILQRAREKTLQLAVTDALTDTQTWGDKLLALAKAIQPHVPFDYAIVGLESGAQMRQNFSFYRTGPDEYQTGAEMDFCRLSGLSPERYAQISQQTDVTQPLLLNGADFKQYCRQHELNRIISQTFRLQSHLMLPIPLTRGGCFLLSLYCRDPEGYRPRHLDQLCKVRQAIALTLDRLLAYEEVEVLSKQLKQENTYLQEEVRTNYRFEEIVGTSQVLREVFEKVSRVGPMSSTVLILGETGTGKELVARAIHQASPRHAKPLIKINCAALPAQLIESELFGHEKGAFTGAIDRRIGKFELAHESTIFLDEIGELPLELQAKLLRAIQEKEIERLGSNKVIQTDVRVLAATNRNLEKEVAEGRFRSDLYFRLNVYPIKLPPLRERKEDIPLLAIHFSQKLSKKLGKSITGLSNGAINEMQSYHWPGNIRELEHVIERAAIESVGGTIKNLSLRKRPEEAPTLILNPAFQLKSYADGERELIMNTLRYCNGRIRGAGGAAQLLKIKATTLEARMKKLGIKREFFIQEQAGSVQAMPTG